VWAAAWGDEDDPDYVSAAMITIFDPPRRLVLAEFNYCAKTGSLPFDTDRMTTEFLISDAGAGSATIRVVQDGFPIGTIADEFYAGCDVGWRHTLDSLSRYLSKT
jgi:hypothetical protein